MVLAAGFGTRLGPLTDELPKALVPFGDTTLLGHTVQGLVREGFDRVVVNTHYKAECFPSRVADMGAHVVLSHEAEILGTAGGVARARGRLKTPVLIHNVDIVLDALPARALLSRAEATDVCLLVRPTQGDSGSVGLDAGGCVVRLRQESSGVEHASADYMGILALGTNALSQVPEFGCLVGDFLIPRLRAGAPVATVASRENWRDLGSLDDYFQGNLAWLSGRGKSAFVGKGAKVSPGVTLDQCVVGAGAQVLGRGRLERCVVWPGARVEAPLRSAIVTPKGVVPVESARA